MHLKNENYYVPWRIQTDFSLLSSSIKCKAIIDHAKNNGFPTVAIADTNNLFAGAEYSFYACAQKYPAILGASIKTDAGVVLLYCKNELGYSNLCKVISDLHTLYNCIFPLKKLEAFADGLLCLSGGVDGVITHKDHFLFLNQIFKDNFALELNRTEGKHTTETFISQLSNEYSVPVIGTCIAHFIDNSMGYQVLKAIKDGEIVTMDNKSLDQTYKLLNPEEFKHVFNDCPVVVENTLLFAQKCGFLIKQTKPRFAFFANDAEHLLRQWANQGLEFLINKENWFRKDLFATFQEAKTAYFQRLNYELDMIEKMGFVHYFLIVADFVRWAREQKISLAARGSGGGSLVAWALFITVVDPIVFGLFFERFINPGRVSLPDFDIDFCQDRRGEVIEYVKNKYGFDKIAHIITFGTLHARGVLRDVGRALGLPYKLIDSFCKRVPSGPNINVTLAQVLETDQEMIKQAEEDTKIKTLFQTCLDLEGVHRNVSLHAAGIVIGDAPLRELLPLYQTSEMSIPATQYTMNFIEKVGLVKFDFLGLTALTIVDKVMGLLWSKGLELDINHIAFDDKRVFDLINKGLTSGVFQLETLGLTDVVLKMQPTNLEDWIAIISLFRPGPVQNIPEFIARKHGKSEIKYAYPALEPILNNTYGIIVYQEQVIAIARDLAGYSLSEADLLRRAMGKKDPEEMRRNRQIFAASFVQRQGGSEEGALALFDQIEKFSGYAFNKSHAACYAFIIYQNAYLKTYFPAQFMAISMTMEKQKHEKIACMAAEFKALGLELMPPCVNQAFDQFYIENATQIRYCLSAIKGIGDSFALGVKNKHFKSIEEFCRIIKPSKKVLESLIFSGSLDKLEIYDIPNENSNQNTKYYKRNMLWLLKDELIEGKGASLFGTQWSETFTLSQLLVEEFKATGVILSAPELDSLLPCANVQLSFKIKKDATLNRFTTQGIVVNKDLIKTKTGMTQWAVKLVDQDGLYEVFVKNEIEQKINIQEGMVLKIQSKNVRTFWIADKLEEVKEKIKTFFIEIKNQEQLDKIHALFKTCSKGKHSVVLSIYDEQINIGSYQIHDHFLKELDLCSVRSSWKTL